MVRETFKKIVATLVPCLREQPSLIPVVSCKTNILHPLMLIKGDERGGGGVIFHLAHHVFIKLPQKV